MKESEHDFSSTLGVTLIFLTAFPAFYLILLILSGFLNVDVGGSFGGIDFFSMGSIIISVISLCFCVTSSLLYFTGILSSKNVLIKIGFGLGIPYCALSIIGGFFIFIVFKKTNDLIWYYIFLNILDTIGGTGPHFPYVRIPELSDFLQIFYILNVVIAVIYLILSSIILYSKLKIPYYKNFKEY